MQSIVLKDFKSYQYQALSNLNSRINVVIGQNGQGKSNFFKAISFLFTDRFTINRTQFISTYRRGANVQEPELKVEVTFNESLSNTKDSYKISKEWKNFSNEDMKINQKSRSKAQFQNFIQSFGFSYSNPYNIVQQGKVTQVTNMNQNQLYLLLEETAGVKRFLKKHQQAMSNLEKIQIDMKETQQNLTFLRQRVGQVEQKKNQFQFYSMQQKVRKIKQKRHFLNYMQGIKKGLLTLQQKYNQASKDLNEKKSKQQQLMDQIQQKQRQMGILNQKQFFYQKQQSSQMQGKNLSKNQIQKTLIKKRKNLKETSNKISKQQEQLFKLNKKLNQMQKQLSSYKQKYQMIKLDFQIQGESKDIKKMKQAYNIKIKNQQEIIKINNQDIQKLQKQKKQYKVINIDQQIKQLQKLKKEQNQQLQDLKKKKIALIQLARKKINLQCEINSLHSKKKNKQDILRKILPNVDFKLLNHLNLHKIQGVYGYLLTHLKIHKDVSFAYELTGLSKLSTLLVKDEKVAMEVVQLNKKLKGKNINILPLSFIQSQMKEKRTYPKMQNCYSLLNNDWISIDSASNLDSKVKAGIQKIINNTFSRYMLVEDYSTALKVSKQYNINCITGQRQIVYADAFMSKVGRQQYYDKGKIEIFKEYEEFIKNFNEIIKNLRGIQKQQVELQNEQVQKMNIKQKNQMKINQNQKKIQQSKKMKQLISMLDSKKKQLQQLSLRCKSNIQKYQKSIKNLDQNVKIKFKQEDFNTAKNQYFNYKAKLDTLNNQIFEIQKQIINLKKTNNQLTTQINDLEIKYSMDFDSKQQILKTLQKDKNQCLKAINSLNQKLTKLSQENNNLKEAQIKIFNQIVIQQQNQKNMKNKIINLGDINEEQQDQIQELSHSMSLKLNVDSLRNKKRQFYTAVDKLFFRKISQYLKQVNQYTQTTNQLQQQKKKLQRYIRQTERQAKQYMNKFINNFEKEFINLFKRIVRNGKAQLKTKIHTEKVKGITKNAYSIEIKVNFNDLQGTKKWSQFSGGQKTVLALCIILGIQKCQPSPFCILDQVDAALDQNYTNKIMEIIIQESKNCQYFITSFKKSIFNLPSEITNFYIVKSHDRVSTIHQIQKEEVINIISSHQ